ncbi:MAG: HAD-IIA family hydrolase [Sciscionella sp.]
MSGSLVDFYDTFLLDLDGTVYRGGSAVTGAADAVRELRERGRGIGFVTNNASRAPEQVVKHLGTLGVAADPAEVHTSAQAAARVLAERLGSAAEVLVVGSDSLADELASVGLRPVREAADTVAAVVQGWSSDIGWAQLAEACIAINAGAGWVACNVDPTLPTERGQLPGNGSLVAALRTATGAEPFIAGKPGSPLFLEAIKSTGAERALVVGDRLDTDIAGAHAAELDSLLVLSGSSTPGDLLAAPPEMRPTYLSADLRSLTEPLDTLRIQRQPGWTVQVGSGAPRIEANGEADALALLRTLCDAWWSAGVGRAEPVASDDAAGAALAELGIEGQR